VAVRVAIADDSLLVREGLRELLAGEAGIEVVASCADLPSLLDAIDENPPDVVVTDIRMPPTQRDEGIRAAIQLRDTHPHIGVVVLSQYDEPSYVLALLEGGSARRGYLLKERVHDRRAALSSTRRSSRCSWPRTLAPGDRRSPS
jgi:DNA-binding NarL/FixJ family response regulator